MAQSNLYVSDVSAEEARILLDLALSIGVGARYARFDTPTADSADGDANNPRYQVVVDHADVRDFVRELCRRVTEQEGAAVDRLERAWRATRDAGTQHAFSAPLPGVLAAPLSAAARRRGGPLTAAHEDATDDA